VLFERFIKPPAYGKRVPGLRYRVPL
jgi:hypothetical protein